MNDYLLEVTEQIRNKKAKAMAKGELIRYAGDIHIAWDHLNIPRNKDIVREPEVRRGFRQQEA